MSHSKWGRHRCRPHSHRCVVISRRDALGIQCLAVNLRTKRRNQGSSPALAPASGFTLRRAFRRRSRPKPSDRPSSAHLHQAIPRTDSSNRQILGGVTPGSKTPCRQPRIAGRSYRPANGITSHDRHRLSLPAGALVEFLGSCVDRSRHVIPDRFYSVQSTRRPSEAEKRRFRSDKTRMPTHLRFAKLASRALSTIFQFDCGPKWITHRLSAMRNSGPDLTERNNLSCSPLVLEEQNGYIGPVDESLPALGNARRHVPWRPI